MRRYIAAAVLIIMLTLQMPISVFADGYLAEPDVQNAVGAALKKDGTATITTGGRSVLLVFEEGAVIDSSTLGGITLEAVTPRESYDDGVNATVLTEKNKVRVNFSALETDVLYRLNVPATVGTGEKTLESPFSFDFSVIDPNYEKGIALGEEYTSVTAEDCIDIEGNAFIEDGVIEIQSGGSVTFGFYAKYALRGFTMLYESGSGDATVKMGEREYVLNNLDTSIDGGEYRLLFYKYLGKEKQLYTYNGSGVHGYYREFAEHRGEWEVTVTATETLRLRELRFLRELTTKPQVTLTEPQVSEEISATYSTVILDVDSPAMIVNGGRRYVDYNDTTTTPYEYKSRLYLPINTLAKALGYYHEEDTEKGYALMRSNTHDVVLLGGCCYIIEGLAEKQPLDEEVLIYRNGQTYGAVRYFAELIGDTVGYSEGMVVIDNKYTVEDVLTPGSLNDYVKSTLAPFKEEAIAGKTYYVDQNSTAKQELGTQEAPFKTISQAAEEAEPGDTVIVKDGIYRETLKPKNSGNPNAPITFRAEGENVVISAADVVDGWTQSDGNVWTAPMNWDLGVTRNQVFIDDKMLNEARYPNGPEILFDTEKLDNAWPVKGDLWRPAGEENTSVVRSSTLLWQKEPNYWAGGYFVGHFGFDYSVMTANIIGSSEGELILGDQKSTMWYTDEGYFNYGYIVGHMNCLDAPGEWIHQDDTLYMIFPEGATPNQTQVEAKARQLVIDLKDRNYINVEGFKTIGGSARTNEGQMNVMNGLDMKYITHFIHQSHPYKGEIDFPFDPKNENGNVERGESGIYLSGSDNCVINCNIDHTAGAGVFLSGLYSYIENNVITDSYNSNYVSGIQIMSRGYEAKNKPRGGHFIYNNTVCKAGRSCLNISTQQGTEHSLFLPCDIAYNDFHDATLTTRDTGITYDFGVQLGVDGYNTKLHHNYIYMTASGKDRNPGVFAIYHDGNSHGTDTYKNQVFHTGADAPFGHGFVYEQTFETGPAYHRVWDNSGNLLVGGIAALDEKYFTEGKMYYAGAMREPDTNNPVKYTKNYDKFIADNFGMDVVVSPENISDGVIYDSGSGYAAFTAVGQTITFKDVTFPENSSVIALMVRGDSYETGDVIDITIGDKVYEATIFVNGYDNDDPERVTIPIGDTSGQYDVVISVKDFKSLQIGGMYGYKDDKAISDQTEEDIIQQYSAYRWAGEFDDTSDTSPPSVLNLAEYPNKKLLNGTYDCWVKYDDVEFKQSSDKFVMAAGSGGTYAHQPIEVYVEDKESTEITGEPAASFIEDSDDWSDRDPQLVPLDRTIDEGTYDVYVKFNKIPGEQKTCTVIYIGFLGAGDIPAEIGKELAQVYGGEFVAESSTSNPDFPFRTAFLTPPNHNEKSLTYTLPGTCAAYEDVSVLIATDSMVISYSCEEGLDGQPVEIFLGDPESSGEKVAEFVTESTGGYMNFREVTVNCSKIIPVGTYDVYFRFGGEATARKTINLEWFCFLK